MNDLVKGIGLHGLHYGASYCERLSTLTLHFFLVIFCISRGVSFVDIQHLLGHEDLETTQIYIQSLVGADSKAIEAFSRKLLELPYDSHTADAKRGQPGD